MSSEYHHESSGTIYFGGVTACVVLVLSGHLVALGNFATEVK